MPELQEFPGELYLVLRFSGRTNLRIPWSLYLESKTVSSDFQTPRSIQKKGGAFEFLKPTSSCLEIG